MKPEIDGAGRCSICGKPVQAQYNQCSATCNLASRIPVGDPLPATWELFAALISGLVLFNQGLFWVMACVKDYQGNPGLADRFSSVSLIAGILWLVCASLSWLGSKPKRIRDGSGLIFAIAILVAMTFQFSLPLSVSDALMLINMLISIQLYYGMYALWRSLKKREK